MRLTSLSQSHIQNERGKRSLCDLANICPVEVREPPLSITIMGFNFLELREHNREKAKTCKP